MKEKYLEICNLDDNGTYIASDEFVNELKAKNIGPCVNVVYSDYGGTFFDKVLISYMKKDYPNNIIVESSAWSGENAFIFGDILPQLIEDTNTYLLKFETIEEYFCEMEQKEYSVFIDELVGVGTVMDNQYERDLVVEYLEENANIEPSGVCVDEYELLELLKERRNEKNK